MKDEHGREKSDKLRAEASALVSTEKDNVVDVGFKQARWEM